MDFPETELEELNTLWTHQGYKLDKGDFTTAIVHLYRAEVTRTNLWRNRLDTTTNWAVVTTGAALTFTFSSPQNPHIMMLFVLVLAFTFLNIEARRYTYYALWHYRVRLLETEFFAKLLVPPFQPRSDWRELMHETLMEPAFLITRWKAIANRYRRNYIWIISLIILSWLVKLMLHPTPIVTLPEILERATIPPFIPGIWVIGAVVGVYTGMLLLTLILTWQPTKNPGQQGKIRRAFWLRPKARTNGLRLAIIITNKKKQVSERLMQELSRGVTALEGIGMYTGESRDVLLCALTNVQVAHLEEIVQTVDQQAFVVITGVNIIHGKSFPHTEPPS